MAVIPSTQHVDLGKLHHRLRRRVGLAIEREVVELFPDCDPGAIPASALPTASRPSSTMRCSMNGCVLEAGDHEALVHVSGQAFATMMAGVPHARFTHHV